jgi:type IV secretory pathway protease TraF
MRHIVGALAITLLLTTWTQSAKAAASWFTVEVLNTGVTSDDLVLMRLKDTAANPAFNTLWCMAPNSVRKEMLAIGLTVMASNNLARILVDPDEPGFPEILRFYLKQR